MGRLSTFDIVIAEQIVEQIAEGVPLREICRQEGMPAWRTVYDWQEAHPDFAARIARARASGFDAIASECVEIADHTPPISDCVQQSKLRIETRLKLLAKWDPKRYGDKVDVSVTRKTAPQDLTDDDLAHIARGGSAGAAEQAEGADQPRSVH